MLHRPLAGLPAWSVVIPLAACAVLLGQSALPLGRGLALAGVLLALMGAVLVAVHHAEVIAHRLGEPFGTLVLALAVTIIEVSLIITLMRSGGEQASGLARDTVYATVMIICNGVIGLCLLMGALRHRVLAFRVEGTSPALSVLTTLAALTLVMPSFTSSSAGPTLSSAQLLFVGLVSLVLYAMFVFVQTVRHRDYFLPMEAASDERHAAPPSALTATLSLILLSLSLVAVVGLAKALAPTLAEGVAALQAPAAVVGIFIALLVLLPETGAAVRAARRNRMQTSFNLALGSALATIGLTIPAVAVTAWLLEMPLLLGLPAKEMVLLGLTLLISSMTLSRGQATVMQGSVHLVLFAVFLFFAIVP
ncbi:MAG TPA: hypothetical protein VFV27_00545 [Nevskiaceae bacterium]|nr:hypothetical protein [Nevskiaceae bacterium]